MASPCRYQRVDGTYCAEPSCTGHPGICFGHLDDPQKDLEAMSFAGVRQSNCEGFVFPPGYRLKAARQKHLSFARARFLGEATFSNVNFERVQFDGATFGGKTTFAATTFGDASFLHTTFEEDVEFSETTWRGSAQFSGSHFFDSADFKRASFLERASLRFRARSQLHMEGARFPMGGRLVVAGAAVSLRGAVFGDGTDLIVAILVAELSLARTHFKGRASLNWNRPHLVDFQRADFDSPENVRINGNLSRALLHGTDLSRVTFDSKFTLSTRRGRKVLFQEIAHSKADELPEHWRYPEDLDSLRRTYQQLKRNFESRKSNAEAGDFYYGEMEMFRRSSRGFHRSVHELYKFCSGYGERAGRALWVFLLVVFLGSVAIALVPGAVPGALSGDSGIRFGQPLDWARLGQALLLSLRSAALLRGVPTADYQASWVGTLVFTVLSILGPLQLAMLIIALRRLMKR